MYVNLHETNNKDKTNAFCYSKPRDVLQIQEEIPKQLDNERNQDIKNFKYYLDEMEKIHENLYNGGTNELTEVSTKVDEYIGTIGIPNSNVTAEKGNKYNGIC